MHYPTLISIVLESTAGLFVFRGLKHFTPAAIGILSHVLCEIGLPCVWH